MTIDRACIVGFDWDAGNVRKNADRHGVSQAEAEEIFFNQPLFVVAGPKHGQHERRQHALGVTDTGRRLHVTFTLRNDNRLIRVVSAQDMSHKEGALYAQAEEHS